ncbi:uncharacterized protein LDX57_005871 [Aspergillus melleus]|uniref:uncharacterized protein n=1 Tax=Aspergillus melleus TaxID=138277 RepID=UPI001E8D29B0|nr:uncharacterized protein LDX57_005871 [Aspergillus melleus]KAH8428166.1 hypothetical protein LDX57_005871 [Aspergillus melleus]
MPPSTVFSYWRRDHRRSSASPVSSAQPTPAIASSTRSASNPPQLPVIPNTAALPTTFGDSSATTDGSSPHAWGDFSPDFDADKLNVAVSATSVNAPSSSSTNLAVPPTAADNNTRPHSSPDECDRDPSITSQSNSSQPSFTAPRPEHADGESSKPNSPFRRSFGKGFLHTQSSDNQSKRLSTSGIAHSGPFRLKASPDNSPAEKTTASQRESRFESASHRRQVDRDVPADTTHHKSGKTRLHLLNPMSLLARRRSSQIASPRTEDVKIGARNLVPAIPDDYDPRIRGNIVHDFSAPRPRRNVSAAPVLLREAASRNSSDQPRPTNGTQRHVSDQILATNEQNKRHSEYSPAFKEHFEDDQRALQVESKGYLQSSLLTNPPPRENDAQSLPVFARNLPTRVPEQEEKPEKPEDPQPKDSPPPPTTSEPADIPQDSDTIDFVPHQPSGLPKHLKSNASRFSFDMNGVESSTQEKLLEEKHKEKEAARRAKARLEDPEFSDGEDDYDNELLDDLDGLEEKIPGVNADADEDDEFSGFSGPGDILNKSWLAPGLSPVIASPVSQNAPSIPPTAPGQSHLALDPAPASAPKSKDNEYPTSSLSPSSESPVEVPPPLQPSKSPAQVSQIPTGPPPNATQFLDDDDDLYFDDGEFGDLTADAGGERFDESIFDDETSHLYDRKRTSEPTAPVPQQQPEKKDELNDALSSLGGLSLEAGPNGGLKHVSSIASEYRPGSRKYSHVPGDMQDAGAAKAHGGVLSEHNLEALHNALAKAANQTATDDRFDRTVSVSERSLNRDDVDQPLSPQPGLVSDDSHFNQSVDMASFEQGFEDFDFDDNDASFYDDPIIAAANAEALENDDEGFYGQEFGFYAQAHGNGELTNGGYFGPRGVEGITRSFSSRGKFREPSLTPITERSELGSTRNSMISVSAHGAAHSNPLSPGLAQLVDLRDIEDDISLSALIRLRRGAWGGSNGSLRSGSGSPPPNLQTASNRASFTGLSDVSPTVYNAPPDLFGGPSTNESPIRETYRGAFT